MLTNKIKYTTERENFIIVPAKNPTKDPKAARTAFLTSELCVNSPAKAPTNGPDIKPIGPKKKPISRPIPEPIVPIRVPPNFFVPQTGSKVSNRKIKKAMANVMVKKEMFCGTVFVR